MSNTTNLEIIVNWRLKLFQKPLQRRWRKTSQWLIWRNENGSFCSFIHSFILSKHKNITLGQKYKHTMHCIYAGSSPWPRNVAKESIQEPGSPNFGFPFLLSLIPVAQWPLHLLWLPYSSVTGTHASHMVPRKKGRRSLTPSFWPLITGSQRV